MEKQNLKLVLVMAAGTGGHVFPGLTIAHYLKAQGVQVHWLGSFHGMEATWVKNAGFTFHAIAMKGLRGKGFLSFVLAPFKLIIAFIQSLQIIKKINPDVVIGMGGFVTGPGGFATWLLRTPLIIHEQNAVAGLANYYLSFFSQKVLQGFPNVFAHTKKAITVGNPVRTDIEALPPPDMRLQNRGDECRLLILGGSLGAQALNQMLPLALSQLSLSHGSQLKILHQTGDKGCEDTIALYKKQGFELGDHLQIVPFIHEMNNAYAWADMVLCRAGALTIAELCSIGLGAILVPYPYAVDDHQTVNAAYMVNAQAAICVQQSALTSEHLASLLLHLVQSPDKRLAMAKAAYQLRQNKVVENIVKVMDEVVGKRR